LAWKFIGNFRRAVVQSRTRAALVELGRSGSPKHKIIRRKDMRRFGISIVVSLLMATVCHAQESKAPAGASVAIRAGKVLDVRTGNYGSDQIIWIEGEKIKAIGKAAEIQKQLAAGTKIIDLSSLTILPGLIDSHTHLTSSPQTLGPARLRLSYPRMALLGARNARVTLEAGFTTVRAADGYSDIALRDAIRAGDVAGPRMLASGPSLSITGGHGDENFLAPQFASSKHGVANGVEGVTAKVRENIKYGADVIKFIATGGVISEGDNPELAEYSLEEMKTIVETAHALGRKVAAHAHGALGIKYAVLAGVDSIEHGSYISDEEIQLMKDHGTYLVPTVYLEDWLMAGVSGGLPATFGHFRQYGPDSRNPLQLVGRHYDAERSPDQLQDERGSPTGPGALDPGDEATEGTTNRNRVALDQAGLFCAIEGAHLLGLTDGGDDLVGDRRRLATGLTKQDRMPKRIVL
jgi:imidazolonepropionase-like amidohydrolase